MMKICLLIISVILFNTHSNAQKNQWTVNTGESVKEVLGDSVIYRYPQFLQGAAYYKDGTFSHAPLNLNLITGEMEFITSSKDTLAVANETTIDYITIQTDTFYFDKVYIELVHSNDAVKLGRLAIIKLTDVKKEGAFGQMSSTSSISSAATLYNDNHSFYSNSQSQKLIERSAITLQKETFFFIADSLNNFLPAVKKNINKMFSEKIPAIESFIKENKIVLNKENDLVELINFLGKT